MKHTGKRIVSLLLCLMMVLAMVPGTAFASSEPAVYEKITTLDELTTGQYVMVVDTGYAPTVLDGSWVLAETVEAADHKVTDPAANLIWTLTVDGTGVKLTDSNGASIAPKGGNNNGISSGEYRWAVACTDGTFTFAGTGDDTVIFASNVSSDNKFRGYKTSTAGSYPDSYPADFTLYKLAGAGETPDPEPAGKEYTLTNTLSAGDVVVLHNAGSGMMLSSIASGYKLAGVAATPAEGVITTGDTAVEWVVGIDGDGSYTFTQGEMVLGMVQSGTYVNLSTNAADGCTAWTLESGTAEGVFYLKNANMPAGNFGPYYLEYYSGYTAYGSNSPSDGAFGISFYKYDDGTTPDPDPEPDPEPDPVVSTVADGVYVIWESTNGKAATALTGNYGYLQTVDVTLTGGVLTGYGETEAWTIVNVGEGRFTIQDSNGKYLYLSGSYNSFNVSVDAPAEGHLWSAVENGDGTYTISNVLKEKTVAYDTTYGSYGAYAEPGATHLTSLTLTGYVAPETPEPTPDPEVPAAEKMTTLPGSGDTVIIYNSGNAMGSAASGSKLSAVAAEVTEGKLPISEGMAQLLVTVEDGVYIFTLDGKYLTSADTGNGLSFADELTDCGKWTAEAAVDGAWYLKNVGANYNGNYNQAMEYYSGFTTYGIKETEIYQMQFFLVKAAEAEVDTGRITSADQFTTGSYVMVVETGYAPGVLDGSWVTAVQPVIVGDQVTDAKGGIWTLTVDGGSVVITDANGVSIAPKGGNNNGISSGAYSWDWSFDEATQTFTFSGTGSDTVVLASNSDAPYGNKFRGYKTSTVGGNPAVYPSQFTLYRVDPGADVPEADRPADGDQVVIYNLSAQGVLAAENDAQSIENALTELVDGKAIPTNGGVVFTVEVNGGYYRFYNETYGYLCSNGTGNNAFYTQEAGEDADWTLLPGKKGGWNLESRTAKHNGTYSQYLEYYADSYKTYSMYNVTDYDIYEFFFYPVAEDVALTGGIVNEPAVDFGTLADAFVGADYTFAFTVDAVFGVDGQLTVKLGEEPLAVQEAAGIYTVTIPAAMITGESLTVTVTGVDTKGAAISGTAVITVKDEPAISAVTPAAGAETGEDLRPVISAVITNAGAEPTVTMTVNGEIVDAVYDGSKLTYAPQTDLAQGRTSVTVTVTRADGKEVTKTWSFTVGEAQYQLYFGQLHSHTTYSDGSGSLESALDYIASLPDSAKVDFVAFTDHSNYFDTTSAANPEGALYDMSLASASSQSLWNSYKGAIAAFNASQSDVVAIGGFEMTWSGGPGHINTFATEGIVSRNNSTLNNKTADAGMKAYYALISQAEGVNSISQFNHPGSTFGTFTDFAYWDALVDTRIHLVEVGNGEGAIGAGGYYPSYEYYTMALDKGWHVAPTNNQDNHKGKWGNANDARNVIITDDFSEEGIYEAIRNYRVYSTEDRNLEILYTVNGLQLGSIIAEVPEVLNLSVNLYDPDASDSISKVEVIVNSGRVAHTWDDPAVLAAGELTAQLAPDYSYYYIRVTQGDGDIAVTAPVWVGETLKLGISAVECGTSTPVTGEELTITTTLFNSETADASVKSVTYTSGGVTLATDTTGYTIPASGTLAIDWKYIPDAARLTTVTVTVVMEQDGVEYTFTMAVELDVQDASKLVYIGIDASHYNEYVNGNYKDSMGNFGQLAAGYSVRTVTLNTSEDLIAACSNDKYVALILTAPSRRLAAAQSDPRTYSDDELAAIVAFNAKGGTVILAGWSDNYENYPVIQGNPDILHMAAAQNAILEALGSSLRIGDDATYDDVRSAADGVEKWRLYFNTYGDSFLTDGVEVDSEHPYDRLYTEVFSHYGGATVYTVDGTLPATVTPVVYGHASTYSVDVDLDGLGGNDIPKYTYAEGDDRLLVMATEQLEGKGLIVVSGAAFMSNFEVQATIEDSGSEKNYSNYRICENLVRYLNPVTVTPIAEVQAQTEVGYKYTIEGVVTSNASGYDKDTAFFDCIYVQDATGGICCFPVAGNYKIGDLVRITGTTEFYQGEMELQVTSIEVIGEGAVEPVEVTAEQINDGSVLGQLITLSGTVVSYELANGLVQTIMVRDAAGNVARVFIDGYITTAEDVENLSNGCKITVTGLASYDNTFNAPEGPFPRIRVRSRADVVCTAAPIVIPPIVVPDTPVEPEIELPFEDVDKTDTCYDAVKFVWEKGLMNGVSATEFAPESLVSRAMIVTVLWRLEGEPVVNYLMLFEDVAADTWYTEAVRWASAMGIVEGYSDSAFGPNDLLTRQQLAAILHRYAVYAGKDVSKLADLTGYADHELVAAWAAEPMAWAVELGLIKVDEDALLNPDGKSTRAEIAQLMKALCEE